MGSTKYGTESVGDFIAENIVDKDDNLNINDENIGLGKIDHYLGVHSS